MLSSRISPRGQSARRGTAASGIRDSTLSSNTASGTVNRGMSVTSVPSVRATGPPPTASDVFEVVADGNAEMLVEMIDFSGAKHLCELRSKKQEDYGTNLLHCAVTNGQLTTLQVLLKYNAFDPNQVDSVYTRSTPMMEAVKIGRLDLIECLVRAGGRLNVQDVNGDTVLHWAAREVSAAFLRQVLQLARKHGSTAAQLTSVLQMQNNNNENAADVGANDVARASIRRLVSGEEQPGVSTRKSTSAVLRSSRNGLGQNGSGGGAPPILPSSTVPQRHRSAAAALTTERGATALGTGVVTGVPAGVVPGVLGGAAGAGGVAGGERELDGMGRGLLQQPQAAAILPKVKGVATGAAVVEAADTSVRARAASTPVPLISSSGTST